MGPGSSVGDAVLEGRLSSNGWMTCCGTFDLEDQPSPSLKLLQTSRVLFRWLCCLKFSYDQITDNSFEVVYPMHLWATRKSSRLFCIAHSRGLETRRKLCKSISVALQPPYPAPIMVRFGPGRLWFHRLWCVRRSKREDTKILQTKDMGEGYPGFGGGH